jgi:hypothetical protein
MQGFIGKEQAMKKTQFFAGITSLGAGGLLWLLDKTRYVFIFGEDPLRRMSIYPAAFFILLGLLLVLRSLKPVISVEVKK